MYKITIQTSFSAAHNLINYHGDCEILHGHNWKVEVAVVTNELDSAGIGIDYKVLKHVTGLIIKELDHTYLNENSALSNKSPSSEHIARFLYQQLSSRLNHGTIKTDSVTVWESDNASACYYE
jgi:6-pyruvoyltetrahydropterin/6-carboxytetrahydropterin synthase